MADMTEVAGALVSLIAAAIYPNGTSQAPAGGVQAKIYQGWPDPAVLATDLAAHIAHVTVWPTPKTTVTTRHNPEWQQLVAPVPTLIATVNASARTFTLSGTVSMPQAVALIIDGKDYAYGVQTGDTLTSIAAALTALVNVDQTATSVGAVVTIAGSHSIIARIVSNGTSAAEVAREVRIFQVSIWASCFDEREPLAMVLQPALAALNHIALPDGTDATSNYAGSANIDTEQRQGIYRRDISLAIEYPTIVTRIDTTVEIVQTRPAIVTGATYTSLPVINQ